MNGTKTPLQSKTIIASGVAMVAILANLVGINIDPETQMTMNSALTSGVGLASGLMAIYGRLSAKTTIQ